MEINVEISAEQINAQICDAIAKSAIGEELQNMIDKTVKEMSTSYNNPFKQIVHNYISQAIRKLIETEYMDTIEKLVKEKVSKQFTEDMISKMWEAFASKYHH